MIGIDPEKKKDTLEVSVPQEKKTSLQKVSSIRPHRGHTLFEFNFKTKELIKAEFETQTVRYDPKTGGTVPLNKKVIINENCIYISALNKQNAVKKILRAISKNS